MMKDKSDGLKSFLGDKAYARLQIDLAILLGITMAEQNMDIDEASKFLAKQLIERHT